MTVYNNVGTGTVNYYEVGKSQTQFNAAVSYRFSAQAPRWIRRTQLRLGVNNLFDTNPAPANMSSQGYTGGSGSSLWVGRAFSFTTTRDF